MLRSGGREWGLMTRPPQEDSAWTTLPSHAHVGSGYSIDGHPQHQGASLPLARPRRADAGAGPLAGSAVRAAGVTTPRKPGAHRRPAGSRARGGSARFVTFGVIGATVFLLGLGVQIALVRWWHFDALWSYIVQGIISVEVSFLLNRYWTWRDVDVPFFQALWKFNAQKTVATIGNTAVYDVFILSGMPYIAANIATTAIFTVINYQSADKWIFARHRGLSDISASGLPNFGHVNPARCPSVSIVVPCKNNQRTIRPTVLSLLGQDYPNITKVVLVGSTGDATWAALGGITDARLVILEQPIWPGTRDPNVKRDWGIQETTSELIALADSDIVMPPDWLSKGIALMRAARVECVAGGMRTITDSFWGRFVDRTSLAAKTPRVPRSYVVTERNFGANNCKPPITANVIITRALYSACPLDIQWCYGYEDYEWFWRVVKRGYRILFSHELVGRHHHRNSFRALCQEYRRASEGCAKFVIRHPDSPFAAKRRNQAIILPLTAFVATLAAGTAFIFHDGAPLAVTAGIGVMSIVLWEYQAARTVESLLYAPINLVLGLVFLYGLVRGLIQRSEVGPFAQVVESRPVAVADVSSAAGP